MNSNLNYANTGLAQKVEAFSLGTSLDNKSHVVGTYKSAPDFSIPPTPASSYANIHVILDTVHQSTLTRTTQTVLPEPKYNVGVQSRSFSNLPRAVVDTVDPEQPGARSDAALTSLKSEIAPITPGFISLDEEDPFAERTDRDLPESADIGLVDEDFRPAYRSKEWALVEEEERSWRMSRSVDSTWTSNWRLVGQEILSKSGSFYKYNSGSFDLEFLEEQERAYRKQRGVDAAWAQTWRKLGQEIQSQSGSFDLEQLEEQERNWRINRAIDATWSGKWRRVGEEIQQLNFNFDDLSAWVDKLKRDIETQSEAIFRASRFNADEIRAAADQFNTVVYAPSTLSWSQLDKLEETERQYKSSKGTDAILSGKWHALGNELNSYVGSSWSEWLVSIKNKAVREIKADYRALKHVELPSVKLPSLPAVSLPTISLPDFSSGVTKSSVAAPMYEDSLLVDFSFKSNRTPANIIELEEQERSRRASRGVDPIIAGLWYRLGLELKNQLSVRSAVTSSARNLVLEAENLAEKAGDLLGSIATSAEAAFESAKDSLKPVEHHDFIEHGKLPLNFFAFTADKIDFTFKSSRTPQSILDLEEAERKDRLSYGPNKLLLSRWRRILSGGLPNKTFAGASVETFEETIVHAKDVLVEKTSEVIHEAEKLAESASHSRWTGLFGSFAHNIADKTTHLYEAAKESLHISGHHTSVASMDKAEEAERVRRMNSKVDPLTAARLGRVQDELLHFTVKSV